MSTLICHLGKHLDQEVSIKGWVHNVRSSGKIAFLQLRDGSGYTQGIVAKADVSEKVWENAKNLSQESSLIVSGTVTKHPKKEEYELQVKDVQPVQISAEYPISKKEHGPDFLLDNRHLWLRSKKQWAIQRVRNTIINATYEYFADNDFIKIDSPILTPSACEGTTTLFEVPYFDMGCAYLSQSGQLYLEAAVMSHGRVFDFGPTFRAEKSKTRRHLTEFWMMDAEMAYCDHNQNMDIQEELIKHIVKRCLEKNQLELEVLGRDVEKLEASLAPFKRMSYAEAVKHLQAKGSEIKDGDDFGAAEETLLTEGEDSPLFVDRWPAKMKAFYMKRDANDKNLVLGSDLIAPEGFGEIIGGSEREDDYETLAKRIAEHQLPTQAFAWYLDLRKHGSVPHSGFGYGLERITGWMCGVHHIRETIPFPRMITRLTP